MKPDQSNPLNKVIVPDESTSQPKYDKDTAMLIGVLDEQRDLLIAAEQKLILMRWSILSSRVEHFSAPASAPKPKETPPVPTSEIVSAVTTPEPAPEITPPASTSIPTPKSPSPPSNPAKVEAQAKTTFFSEHAHQLKIAGGIALAIALLGGGYLIWASLQKTGPGEGFFSGNGRIEATEIDVASKLPGRVEAMLVNEGDFVKSGQILAKMQIQVLDAQREEARAQEKRLISAVVAADAQVQVRDSEKLALQSQVAVRESELDAAQRRYDRSVTLAAEGASSTQELDDDRARVRGAKAALRAAQAQVSSAQSVIDAAKAQVLGARAAVNAAAATIVRVEADITDSVLIAPRDARVQYRIAQTGEVIAGGGKVLNLVDLADVYLTCFVPEAVAGRLTLGSEVHLVLDAAPQYVIPAKISFVASTAQFTPKTVETASERQKLMFRVKVRIDPALLRKHLAVVKTGVPGIAWFKLDPQAQWPSELAVKTPQ